MGRKLKNENTGLTDFEERFISIWFNTNFNGTAAYMLASPNCTKETAMANSSKLLSQAKIQHEIELRKLKIRNEEDISLGFLVSELKSIIYELKPYDAVEYNPITGNVINKKDYKSMIAAINSLAKLSGLDNHTQKIEIENNNEAPQEITININKSKK